MSLTVAGNLRMDVSYAVVEVAWIQALLSGVSRFATKNKRNISSDASTSASIRVYTNTGKRKNTSLFQAFR